MLRYFILLIFTSRLMACKESASARIDTLITQIIEEPEKLPIYVLEGVLPDSFEINYKAQGNYDSLKKAVAAKRKLLAIALEKTKNKAETDSVLNVASSFFNETLLNQIIPHWYGTIWDYNGYTDIPGEGLIACGYFVSTTLKHIGVNVNRYKLAQAYSLKAVKVLSGDAVIDLSGKGAGGVIAFLQEKEDGFYVVGLDNHIGYLLKRQGQIFFIHSSYLHPGQVCIELAKNALAFQGHNSYVLAQLSRNGQFIKRWLLETEFIGL